MSKYPNLDKFLEKKGKKIEKEKVKKDKSKLKDKDIDKLVLQMLEDFGYIEWRIRILIRNTQINVI